MVEELVAPIHPETHKVALDGISNDTVKHLKKAPVTGGCRVEGYVRVKKVKKPWTEKLKTKGTSCN